MLPFNATQQTILASDYKLIYWLFEVGYSGGTYYWSTKVVPNTVYNSQAYTFKVLPDSFRGIKLMDPSRESESLSTLASTYFEISNAGNTYSTSDFEGYSVHVKLVISDGSNTELMAQWGLEVMSCVDLDQRLGFNCEDFLQPHLEGDYPNTKLVSSISPAPGDPDDDLCLPVIFGTAYIPIRSQYITDQRYYIMGTTADAFTVSEIRSPREFGRSIFLSSSFAFTATNVSVGNVTYRTLRPQIAETDTVGVYATGVWTSGDKMIDPFFKITRTGSNTNPANVISDVLQGMGVASGDIDAASFSAAAAVYSGWGLSFNGAFYKKESRRKVLAQLLIMCNSTLRVTDKIELHPLDLNNSDSVATHTGAEILKESFIYNNVVKEASDSAAVAFQLGTEPVDQLAEITVPAKYTGDSSEADPENVSSNILEIRFVQDSVMVQKIGILHFQRKFLAKANPSYKTKMSELGVQPDDLITVTGTRYGGPHYICVNDVSVNKDASIDISGTVYSTELDNWSDPDPPAVDIAQEYIIFDEVWTTIISGPGTTPDSGLPPAQLPGNIIVGDYSTVNYITINPISTQIILNDDGTDRVVIGYLSPGNYGIAIVDPDGNTIVLIDSSQATFAGWTLTPTQLYSTLGGGTGIVLDSSDKYFAVNDITFGNLGIQGQYNAGDPRFYVGDGGENYLRYESGVLIVSGLTIDANTWDSDEEQGGDSSSGAGGSVPTPVMPSSNDLELLYRFNESSGLAAGDGVGNNDATLVDFAPYPSSGDDSQWVTGQTGNALEFNGVDEYIRFSGEGFPSGTFDPPFSIGFWVYKDALIGHDNVLQFTNRYSITVYPWWGYHSIHIRFNSNEIQMGYSQTRGADGSITESTTIISYNTLQLSTWKFYCYTVDSSWINLYVDGIFWPIRSVTYDGDMSGIDVGNHWRDSVEDNRVIGRYDTHSYYEGKLDEFRIYDKSLNENEVYGLYLNDR